MKIIYLSTMLCMSLISTPSLAAKADYSWRKSGNSYYSFVRDSVDCGIFGYKRDVSGDEPAKAFVRGWRTADDHLNRAGGNTDAGADDWSAIQRRHQPQQRMEQVQALHVGDVETCLISKGYTKFQLNKNQIKTLGRIKKGSVERRRYLYEISIQ